ncbi:hypothetical protein EJ08DRAFT_650145 [Tothia fuscella]|uniref:Uncharacterized protein n=1 Tax=Tothia fuscella TaxID=1048955 RepID=A0A9P4TXS9_9PEZI|nr:hypothetical protein EJ08DRAFT_650145 [Tothia fuscella]
MRDTMRTGKPLGRAGTTRAKGTPVAVLSRSTTSSTNDSRTNLLQRSTSSAEAAFAARSAAFKLNIQAPPPAYRYRPAVSPKRQLPTTMRRAVLSSDKSSSVKDSHTSKSLETGTLTSKSLEAGTASDPPPPGYQYDEASQPYAGQQSVSAVNKAAKVPWYTWLWEEAKWTWKIGPSDSPFGGSRSKPWIPPPFTQTTSADNHDLEAPTDTTPPPTDPSVFSAGRSTSKKDSNSVVASAVSSDVTRSSNTHDSDVQQARKDLKSRISGPIPLNPNASEIYTSPPQSSTRKATPMPRPPRPDTVMSDITTWSAIAGTRPVQAWHQNPAQHTQNQELTLTVRAPFSAQSDFSTPPGSNVGGSTFKDFDGAHRNPTMTTNNSWPREDNRHHTILSSSSYYPEDETPDIPPFAAPIADDMSRFSTNEYLRPAPRQITSDYRPARANWGTQQSGLAYEEPSRESTFYDEELIDDYLGPKEHSK